MSPCCSISTYDLSSYTSNSHAGDKCNSLYNCMDGKYDSILRLVSCDKTATIVDSFHGAHVVLQISAKAVFLAQACPWSQTVGILDSKHRKVAVQEKKLTLLFQRIQIPPRSPFGLTFSLKEDLRLEIIDTKQTRVTNCSHSLVFYSYIYLLFGLLFARVKIFRGCTRVY